MIPSTPSSKSLAIVNSSSKIFKIILIIDIQIQETILSCEYYICIDYNIISKYSIQIIYMIDEIIYFIKF